MGWRWNFFRHIEQGLAILIIKVGTKAKAGSRRTYTRRRRFKPQQQCIKPSLVHKWTMYVSAIYMHKIQAKLPCGRPPRVEADGHRSHPLQLQRTGRPRQLAQSSSIRIPRPRSLA